MTDRGLRIAIGVLALAGAAVAGYLTWVHYRPEELICIGGGGCEIVQKSRYSELGPIPVALLGLVAYLAIGATALRRDLLTAAAAAATALAGLVFALWLVYVMARILDAWCNWCLASDAILTVLTVVTVVRVFRLAEPAPG